MLPLSRLGSDVARTLRDHLRPLIAYHLFFTLLASALLLPLVAWIIRHFLARLQRTVIGIEEFMALIFSPVGLLTMLVVVGLSFLLLYLQHAGMMLVAVRPRDNHYRLAFEALWRCLRRLPALSGLVVMQVGSHLLLLAPFMFACAWLYDFWLGGLDPYYVQRIRPPAFWYFLVSALPLVLCWAAVAAWLYLRWLLALPVLILEGQGPRAALKRSVSLTRGWRRSIAIAIISLLVLIVALPFLVTWVFDEVVTPLLWWLPERNAVLIPAMLAYLTGYVLITLTVTFLGVAANALLSACLYMRLAHEAPRPLPPQPDAHPGRLAWAVELSVLLFAASQAWWIVNSFEIRDEVTIIAHRGSSMTAPENTIAALQQAVADQAHYIELDVRLSADNEVLLYHDTNMMRLTGDPREFGELTRQELQEFDVGSWFGDRFIGETIPGLDQALTAVRGKAGLMIDMKPLLGEERALAEAVLTTLREEAEQRTACYQRLDADRPEALTECGNRDVMQEMRLATMSPEMATYLKAREPDLRITLLAQLVLPGTLNRSGFDALGLRHTRISEEEIELAHRFGYEIHAWTVNGRARMSQLIDLGVDAIITDYPVHLRELMDERRELSDGALMLVKLRNWLRQ
ncbi:glycerophosphodiester phosphodiesterase family protein [Halomonas sp. Bachu 37]|uniref:glycerophosphodiester phosphodiesterase family protein n=1 Tax=Halomonas kashgarensis TaxID=3084920 RepID=UPI003216A111